VETAGEVALFGMYAHEFGPDAGADAGRVLVECIDSIPLMEAETVRPRAAAGRRPPPRSAAPRNPRLACPPFLALRRARAPRARTWEYMYRNNNMVDVPMADAEGARR
jgi:hypothetical protein